MSSRTYRIVRTDDTGVLTSFYCGIQDMDAFIHDDIKGLKHYIDLGLTNLWVVYKEDLPVAFFALSKSALILNYYDREELERNNAYIDDDIYKTKDSYPAIEIDYLAVDKRYRKEGIGQDILALISERAAQDDFSATLFLTVNSLHTQAYSAVSFYSKCGFKESEYGKIRSYNNEFNDTTPTTMLMYKPIKW